MKKIVRSFQNAALVAALAVPFTLAPSVLRAEERRYHDTAHNDDHVWNNHEDRAYRAWAKENHRRYVAFPKLRPEDQQAYWGWRHEHSDATLNINIR
jgi:hypothetical protein